MAKSKKTVLDPDAASTTLDAVGEGGYEMDLDAQGIKEKADAVLQQDLYWFPVRHHSPAVSRHLSAVIGKRKPKMIFLEGTRRV